MRPWLAPGVPYYLCYFGQIHKSGRKAVRGYNQIYSVLYWQGVFRKLLVFQTLRDQLLEYTAHQTLPCVCNVLRYL